MGVLKERKVDIREVLVCMDCGERVHLRKSQNRVSTCPKCGGMLRRVVVLA